MTGQDLHAWSGWLLRALLILTLLFWMVGAHNRLMQLRQAVAQAWALVDDCLPRRALALETLLAAVHDTLAEGEAGSLAALTQALERERQAALVVRPRPFDAVLLQAWVQADRDLVSPLARLQALVEQHGSLDGSEVVQTARDQLSDLAQRLSYARQAYNEAVGHYNQALLEFPTRLLVPLFRLQPAARA